MKNRRDFLKNSGLLAASGLLFRKLPAHLLFSESPFPDRIGVQLFSIPKILEKDFEGTMNMLAKIGYKEIEFFGPYSFSATEDVERWKAVTPSLGFSWK